MEFASKYYINGKKSSILHVSTGELQFTDELESVSREVQKLKLRGVNKIVVLGSSSLNFNRFIATQVDGVDVVIGSGTRTFLYNGKRLID